MTATQPPDSALLTFAGPGLCVTYGAARQAFSDAVEYQIRGRQVTTEDYDPALDYMLSEVGHRFTWSELSQSKAGQESALKTMIRNLGEMLGRHIVGIAAQVGRVVLYPLTDQPPRGFAQDLISHRGVSLGIYECDAANPHLPVDWMARIREVVHSKPPVVIVAIGAEDLGVPGEGSYRADGNRWRHRDASRER